MYHLIGAAALASLYLLLAESTDLPEILVAIATAVIASIAMKSVARHSPGRFSLELAWLRSAINLPVRIVRDSLLVLGATPTVLMRRRALGKLEERSVRHRGEHPGSPGWRALAVIDVSIAPNTFAIRISERHYRMLIHQLVKSSRA